MSWYLRSSKYARFHVPVRFAGHEKVEIQKNQARDVLLFDFAPNEFKSTGRGRFQANPLCKEPCTVRAAAMCPPWPAWLCCGWQAKRPVSTQQPAVEEYARDIFG